MFHICENEKCYCKLLEHEELKQFVINHKAEILHILDIERTSNNDKKIIQELQDKLHTQLNEINQLKDCMELKEKSHGEHSMYKGEYGEKKMVILLTELFEDKYIIDSLKINKKMDIRLIHKEYGFTIGIECKEKISLTKVDLTKYNRDKLYNDFFGSIFISTQSPIFDIVKNEDHYSFLDNDLFIYSNNIGLLGILISCFIQLMEKKFLEKKEDCTKKMNDMIEHVLLTYKNWNDIKKKMKDMDNNFLKTLSFMGINERVINGHIYLGSKSKYKGGKSPY